MKKTFYALIIISTTLIPWDIQAQIDTVFINSPIFKGQYFSNTVPDSIPLKFAEGLINPIIHHYHSAPVFSPKLDEMYFSAYLNYEFPQRIFISKRIEGVWQKPELAPFSGKYQDGSPVFALDGNRLYFYSKRSDLNDSAFQESRIWYVNRKVNNWGEPKLLKFGSTSGLAFYPSHFATDGTFYFNIKTAPRDYEIYQCRIVNDVPIEIQRLNEPISIKGKIEMGAVTNPDNNIMIFQAYNRYDKQELILMVCIKKMNGMWGIPTPLSNVINKDQTRFPSFSRDGKYFFFTSYKSGVEEIYWIDAKYLMTQ